MRSFCVTARTAGQKISSSSCAWISSAVHRVFTKPFFTRTGALALYW
jgi:hypothetical protein